MQHQSVKWRTARGLGNAAPSRALPLGSSARLTKRGRPAISDDIDVVNPTSDVPEILLEAWREYGDWREVIGAEEISANVSTNRVYRLVLSDEKEFVAKVSSYGSFVHFRQDHQRISEWSRLLSSGGFRNFLAKVAERDGHAFVHKQGHRWVAFYHKAGFYDFLPKLLSESDVASLGRNLANFHRASLGAAQYLHPTWKSVGSDIANLADLLDDSDWRRERGFGPAEESLLRRNCDAFLENVEALGYHDWTKIPILIDWNIGNFSVGFDTTGFKFYSRWDYDWFRIEPRMFDFYFASRVVRDSGDQTVFSYTTGPMLEPRFIAFLRSYHGVFPLTEKEILFLAEAYRFFILNYVVQTGEHFFRPLICKRLMREALDTYLPSLDSLDLRPVVDAVLGG
jgi:Ser/Thr protein kinase RdoA (MazF antagonist)